MELSEFPNAIASAQESLLLSERMARDCEMKYQWSVNEIESAIAFDEALKNEAQRKSARLHQLQQPQMMAILTGLHDFQDDVKRKRIGLELLQNQFAVAKLIERRAVSVNLEL